MNCAPEWDPTDKAVSYWLDETPANDARAAAFALRKQCNEIVFAALQGTDELLNEASQPNRISLHDQSRAALSCELKPSLLLVPGTDLVLADDEADGLRTNAYNKALAVRDEFFHFSLYDWYVSRGMTDQLLEVRVLFWLFEGPLTLSSRLGLPTSNPTFPASPRRSRSRTSFGSTSFEPLATPRLPLFSPHSPTLLRASSP